MKSSSCFSAQWFLRISSVVTEQSQFYATSNPKILGLWRNVQHLIIWKRWKFLPISLLQKFLPMHSSGKPCAGIRAEIRTIVRILEIIQTMFWCGFEACRNRTILPYYWYRRTTDATLTPRIYDVSRWKRDSYNRLDSQEYEDRSSLEQVCCHDDRYSIEVQIPRPFEDNTVSYVRIVNGVEKYVTESMLTKKEEDTAVVKPNTKARPFRSYSCCWKEMDRHWDTAVARWKVLWGVKNHHPIADTQPNMQNRLQQRTPISIWSTLITFYQTEHILVPMLCCMSLKTMKPWLKGSKSHTSVKNRQSCFGMVVCQAWSWV